MALISDVWDILRTELHFGMSDPNIEGKHFLALGGGYFGAHFVQRVKAMGGSITLIDDIKVKAKVESYVDEFIGIENYGAVSLTQSETIINIVKNHPVKFDAVFTLVEDQTILVATLCEAIGCEASPLKASIVARDKAAFRIAMREAGIPAPQSKIIHSMDDIVASKNFPFPAFLKPNYGVAAYYSSKVNNFTHLQETYASFAQLMNPDSMSIYHAGMDMQLEQLLVGDEIQLEVIVHKGEVVFHSFSGQYATDRKWLVYPVVLSEAQQTAIVDMVKRTVKAVGLTTGIVHFELFIEQDSEVPWVIELNNRLSRGFLCQRLTHQILIGRTNIDYLKAVLYTSLGLHPMLPTRHTNIFAISVFPDLPSKVGWETHGPCAVFAADTPENALTQGLHYVEDHPQPAPVDQIHPHEL